MVDKTVKHDPLEREILIEKAVGVLLVTGSNTKAAESIGVPRSTWHRWCQTREFREALEYRKKAASKIETAQLGELFHRAAGVLLDCLDESQEPETRLKAARAVMQYLSPTIKASPMSQPQLVDSTVVDPEEAAKELARRRLEGGE